MDDESNRRGLGTQTSAGSRDASQIVRSGGVASASESIAIALWTSGADLSVSTGVVELVGKSASKAVAPSGT
jgi:hypothetical protein